MLYLPVYCFIIALVLLYCIWFMCLCVKDLEGYPSAHFGFLLYQHTPFIIYSMVLYIIIFSGNQGYTNINFKINGYIFVLPDNNPYICTL